MLRTRELGCLRWGPCELLTRNDHSLICSGDHKQLQPSPSHYDLERVFKLNVSLFERLVSCGLEHKQLQTQRRMHPWIRELSSFHYDIPIADGGDVARYPPVAGLTSRLFFFSHTHREGGTGNADEPGKFNSFEADMIVRLAIYLCNSGRDPKTITILTTYKEQLRLIKKTLVTLVPNAEDPKHQMLVRVVDKYQGTLSESGAADAASCKWHT